MSSFCCDPSRYLPHRTPMLLIDRVLAADAETTRCRVTVGEQCSLFRQADGSYPNSLFIEFMAQTVGVLQASETASRASALAWDFVGLAQSATAQKNACRRRRL